MTPFISNHHFLVSGWRLHLECNILHLCLPRSVQNIHLHLQRLEKSQKARNRASCQEQTTFPIIYWSIPLTRWVAFLVWVMEVHQRFQRIRYTTDWLIQNQEITLAIFIFRLWKLKQFDYQVREPKTRDFFFVWILKREHWIQIGDVLRCSPRFFNWLEFIAMFLNLHLDAPAPRSFEWALRWWYKTLMR